MVFKYLTQQNTVKAGSIFARHNKLHQTRLLKILLAHLFLSSFDSVILFCQHYYFFLFRKHLFLKVPHIKYCKLFVQHFIQVHIISSWSFRFTSYCLLHDYLSTRTGCCNRRDYENKKLEKHIF